jgi:RNA polymerase sigma-70 factor, ECF subfamily
MDAADKEMLTIARAMNGNQAAFKLLFDKYRRRILKVAESIVRNDAEAEDVMLETFERAFHSLRSFRGDSAFYTWLHRISMNVAFSHRRALIKSKELEDTLLALPVGPLRDPLLGMNPHEPDKLLEYQQTVAALEKLLLQMPAVFAEALVQNVIDGHSDHAIAQGSGISHATVRSRIFRARNYVESGLASMRVNDAVERKQIR